MDIKKSFQAPDASAGRLKNSAPPGVKIDPPAFSREELSLDIGGKHDAEVNEEPPPLKWYQKIWVSLLGLLALLSGGQARATTPAIDNIPSSSISVDNSEVLQPAATDLVEIELGSLNPKGSRVYSERHFEAVDSLEQKAAAQRNDSEKLEIKKNQDGTLKTIKLTVGTLKTVGETIITIANLYFLIEQHRKKAKAKPIVITVKTETGQITYEGSDPKEVEQIIRSLYPKAIWTT